MTAAADDAVAYPPPPDGDRDEPSLKRQRHEDPNETNQVALYAPPLEDDVDQHNGNIRTSSLAEPTMKLSGHKGSVYCLAYDPQGEMLCSGSFDSTCLLWKGELLCALNVHVYIILSNMYMVPCISLFTTPCHLKSQLKIISRRQM